MDLLTKLGLYTGFLPCEPATEEINQNFKRLDALSQISVLGQVAALPPVGSTGDAYILNSTGHVWVFEDKWVDYGVQEGWLAFDQNLGDIFFYKNGVWVQHEDVSKNFVVQRVLSNDVTTNGIIEEFRVTLSPGVRYFLYPNMKTQTVADTGSVQVDFNFDGTTVDTFVHGDTGPIVGTSLNYQPSCIIISPLQESDLVLVGNFQDVGDTLLQGSSIVIEQKRDITFATQFVI